MLFVPARAVSFAEPVIFEVEPNEIPPSVPIAERSISLLTEKVFAKERLPFVEVILAPAVYEAVTLSL